MAEQAVTAAASAVPEHEPTAPFLRACRGLPVERTPVWLLRQAGRYMPEYRALRERHSLLELVRTSELAAQVTLQPSAGDGPWNSIGRLPSVVIVKSRSCSW